MWGIDMLRDLRGSAPLIVKQITRIVISALSAIGSITVPITVSSFHFRAIQPSMRSVMPAYAKRATAATC